MSIRFDASGDYLLRSTNLPPIATFTMMAWVQLVVDTNAYTTLFYHGVNTPSSSYVLCGMQADGVTLLYLDGITSSEFPGSALSLATWYHVGWVMNGIGTGQAAVYLNGTLAITGNSTSFSQSRLQLANDPFPDPFNGRMANVLIYDVALTAAEVQQQMRQYVPLRWANLNGWYPLLHATNVDDASVNASHWTVGGTLTTENGPPIPWVVTPPAWRRRAAGGAPLRKAPPPFHRSWRVWRRTA